MIGNRKAKADIASEYREVTVKPAIYTMLVVVAFVAAPLGWLNVKVSAEGSEVADTSLYHELVTVVDHDVKTVQLMLDNEHVDERSLKGSLAPVVTLITPDNFTPTNMDDAANQNAGKLKEIDLSAIYWNPTDPIVTINDENYHVGDMIENHRIIEIRKTEVVFEDPMGEKVVKNFYDYLSKPRK